MKKNLPSFVFKFMSIKIMLMLLALLGSVLLVSSSAKAQTSPVSGDYRNTAASVFSTAANWQTYSGGTWVSASVAPSTSGVSTTQTTGSASSTTSIPLSGSNSLIFQGEFVSGTNITAGTMVSAISGTSLTLSTAPSASVTSGTTLTFSWTYTQASNSTGAANGYSVTVPNSIGLVVGQYVTGTNISSNTTIQAIASLNSSSSTTITLSTSIGATAVNAPLTFYAGGISSNQVISSNIVTLGAQNSNIVAGMIVSGTGISTGTTILSVNAGSAPSTTTTATVTSSASISVTSTVGLYPGQSVSGTGVSGGTYIATITSGTAITVNQTQASISSGTTLTFGTSYTLTLSTKASGTRVTNMTIGWFTIPNIYLNFNATVDATGGATIGNVWVNNASNVYSGGSTSVSPVNSTLGIGATASASGYNVFFGTINIAASSSCVQSTNSSTATNTLYLNGGNGGSVIANNGTFNMITGSSVTNVFFATANVNNNVSTSVTGNSCAFNNITMGMGFTAGNVVDIQTVFTMNTATTTHTLTLTGGTLKISSASTITPFGSAAGTIGSNSVAAVATISVSNVSGNNVTLTSTAGLAIGQFLTATAAAIPAVTNAAYYISAISGNVVTLSSDVTATTVAANGLTTSNTVTFGTGPATGLFLNNTSAIVNGVSQTATSTAPLLINLGFNLRIASGTFNWGTGSSNPVFITPVQSGGGGQLNLTSGTLNIYGGYGMVANGSNNVITGGTLNILNAPFNIASGGTYMVNGNYPCAFGLNFNNNFFMTGGNINVQNRNTGNTISGDFIWGSSNGNNYISGGTITINTGGATQYTYNQSTANKIPWDLVISGVGTLFQPTTYTPSATTSFTIANSLKVNSGATFDLGLNALSLPNNTSYTGTGTLQTENTSTTPFGAFTGTFTGTVAFNGGYQTIPTTCSYTNLSVGGAKSTGTTITGATPLLTTATYLNIGSSSVTGILPGMAITGTASVAANATVVNVAPQVVASASSSISWSNVTNTNRITFTSPAAVPAGIALGMVVTQSGGTGFPAGTVYVSGITGTYITLSTAVTATQATGTSITLTFAGVIQMSANASALTTTNLSFTASSLTLASGTTSVAGVLNVNYAGAIATNTVTSNILNLNTTAPVNSVLTSQILSPFTVNTLTVAAADTLTVGAALTNGTTTINGSLKDSLVGSLSTAPTFAAGTTLVLNPTSTYTVSSTDKFWPSASLPTNVYALTALNMNTQARTVAGTLIQAANITSAGSLKPTGTVQINTTGITTDAAFAAGSGYNLIYNTSGNNTTSNEWTTTAGFVKAVTINSGSLVTAGSDLALTGSWSNSGTFTPNTNLVNFTGSSAATITGATSFYKLTNSNSGGLTLNNAVTVTNTLNLNGGIITTGSNALSVTNPVNTAVSGTFSNTNYIKGNLSWTLPASSAGNTFTFPIGASSGAYYPLAITSPTTSTAGTTVATANAFPTTGSGGSADGTSLTGISNGEYWSLAASVGNITGGTIALTRTGTVGIFTLVGTSTTLAGTYAAIGSSATVGTNTITTTTAIPTISAGNASNYVYGYFTANPAISGYSIGGSATSTGYFGQTLTINGSNFGATATVSFNGGTAQAATVVNSSQVTVTIPTSATTGAVSITTNSQTTPGGTLTIAGYITAQDGDWNTSATWTGGAIPPASTAATINHIVTVNSTVSNAASSVLVNTSKSLTFGASGSLTTTAVVNTGSIVMTSGGTLTIAAGGSFNNTSGTFTYGTGTIVLAGNTTFTGLSNVNNLQVAGTVGLSGVSINGRLTINSGASISSAPTYTSTATLYYNTTSTVGAEWGSGTTLGAGVPQNVTVAAGTVTMPTSARSALGNILISGGTFAMSSTASADLSVSGNWTNSGGTFTPNSRTVNFIGANTTITGPETFDYLVVNKTATSNTLTLASAITINQDLTLTQGIFDYSTFTATLAGNLAVGTGTIATASTGKIAMTGNKNIPAITLGNLDISGSSNTVTATGNLTFVSGATLNVGSGNTFDMNTFTLAVGATFTNTGAGTIATKGTYPSGRTWSSTGTMYFNSSAGFYVINPGTYNNLDASGGVGTATRNLDAGSGVGTGTLTINGNFIFTGSSISTNKTTVVFTGGASQTIPTGLTFYNVTFSTAGTTAPTIGNGTATQTLTINNTFSAGNVTTVGGTILFTNPNNGGSVLQSGTQVIPAITYTNLTLTGSRGYLNGVSATTTSGSTTVTNIANGTTGVTAGVAITGSNIPASTTITGFTVGQTTTADINPTDNTIITNWPTATTLPGIGSTLQLLAGTDVTSSALRVTATYTNQSPSVTSWVASTNPTIVVSSNTGLVVGMYVSAVSGGSSPTATSCYITGISGNNITLSGTTGGSGATSITFSRTLVVGANAILSTANNGNSFVFSPILTLSQAATASGNTTLTSTNSALTFQAGTINVSGAYVDSHSGTIGTLTTNSTPITLTGASSTLNCSSTDTVRYPISIAGGASVAISNRLLMGGTLTVTGTLNMGTNALTGAVGFANSTTGTIQTQSTTAPIPAGQTWGGTIQYNGTTQNQNIMAGTYNNLDISGGTTGTRTFTNGGTYNIAGNYTAPTGSGTVTTTGSTVVFNGSVAQSITNAATFNNLTINKANTTAALTLNSAVTVGSAGVLTLTKGRVLTTSSNSLTVSNTAATAISGGSSTAYIDGPLSRTVVAGSANTYIFPVGNYVSGDNYFPDTLTSIGTAGTITVTGIKTNTGTADGTTVTSISSNEYWSVKSSVASNSLTMAFVPATLGSNTVLASSTTANGTYSSLGGAVSGTSIQAAGLAVGTANVYYAVGVTATPPPTITSISSCIPNITAGNFYARDTLTITGTGFQSSSAVTVGGVSATLLDITGVPTVLKVLVSGTASTNAVYVSNTGGSVTYTGGTFLAGFVTRNDGIWSTGSTWLGGVVPTSTITATVNNVVTLGTTVSSINSLTINSGASITTSNIGMNFNAGATITNNGAFVGTNGTIAMAGAATIGGANAMGLNSITIAGLLTLNTAPSISGNLRMNSGGSVAGTGYPTYGSSSAIQYNTGGSITPGTEWKFNTVSGAGVPYGITIGNFTGSTIVSFGGSGNNYQMLGSLTINSSSTTGNGLILGSANGGDLYIAGSISATGTTQYNNPSANGGSGTPGGFDGNGRKVFFTSNATQTVTGPATGTPLIIPYIVFGSGGSSNNFTLGSDITISAPAGGNAISSANTDQTTAGVVSGNYINLNGKNFVIGTAGQSVSVSSGSSIGSPISTNILYLKDQSATNTATITINGNAGSININADNSGGFGVITGLTINHTGVKLVSGLTLKGDLALTSGTFAFAPVGATARTLAITGNITRTSGNIDASNANAIVSFNGTVQQTIAASTFTNTITNLYINNSTSNGGVTLSQAVTVAGLRLSNGIFATGSNLTIANATTIIIGSGSAATSGSLTGTPTFTGTVNLQYQGGTAARSISTGAEVPNPATYPTALNNLVTAGTSLSVALASNATVNGTLTITGGGVGTGDTLTVNNGSTLTIKSASSVSSNNVVIVNGTMDFTTAVFSGNGTFTAASGSTLKTANTGGIATSAGSTGSLKTLSSAANYEFNGTAAQVIGAFTTSPTSNTVANLTINNSAGVTLSNNLTVTGQLALTSGLLKLSTYNLNVASVTTGSSSNYVATTGTGKFTINSVGNTATDFPIGTATSYAPLKITNTTGTSNVSAAVQSTFTSAPVDPTKVVNLQWSVTGSAATTASVVFQFNNADKASAYTIGTNDLGIFTTGTSYAISSVTAVGSNPYTVTKVGIAIPTSGNNLFVIGNTGAVESPLTTWTGTFNTAWNNDANWDNGTPSATNDAVVPVVAKAPVIASASFAKSLTIASGANIVNNSTLSINSSFTNNGTISGTGTTILSGTSTQTISGMGTVAGLTLNNSAGATVTSGSNKLNITGVLTLQSGTLITNSNVVFKSNSIASSGTLAAVGTGGNSGSISGTVTVERYIPSGYRSYRDIAPSVYNTSNTLYNTYQESGSYSKSGYGMFITGGTGVAGTTSTPNSIDANHFDVSANGVKTAYTYINGNWATVANTNVLVTPFTGYRLLIRGDRSFNLYGTGIPNTPLGLLMYNATRLEASGTLVTGNVTYDPTGVSNAVTGSTYANSTYGLNNLTDSSFNLVANPYVCPVDWRLLTKDSIEGYYYYLDPTIGATGAYVAGNSLSNPYIQAGQAIFIQNKKGYPKYPVIGFTEAAKAPGNQTAVFGIESKLPLALLREESAGSGKYHKMDMASIVFSDSYSNGYNSNEDAPKLDNSSDNLSIRELSATKALSIDGRRPATTGDIIAIQLAQVAKANYQLQVDASSYNSNGLTPYIYDGYTKTYTALESSLNTISFAADNTIAATYANRFRIVFKPTVLAVNSITATASLNSGNISATVSWKTAGEDKVAGYTVEKSTDGTAYTAIGTATAKNTATAAYSYVDNSVANGTTYYRIKATSADGSVGYSNVTTVVKGAVISYSLYPNPVINSKLNVKLENVNAGKYTVSMYNSLGQKVHEEMVSHSGGTAAHSLSITEKLANGVYNVTISSVSSKQVVYNTSVTVQ
ncbi:T9SS type A sorting domain-containing protein [Parasediminibacterium sp. JCM 36343]|uniref:T9SS type A sorting domain-containing protein n=1 Tax=Parasediminibacterium sp. JCM 36343 TaxID=3374279 RepID=UPI003979722D